MKNVFAVMAVVMTVFGATSASAFGGGSIGVPVGGPLDGVPRSGFDVDGDNVRKFYSCLFSSKCRVKDLDLKMPEEKVKK